MSGSDIRTELADGATRWLAETYGEARRRRTLAESGFDEAAWREMAGLGWFGIAAPEDQNGLGLGLGDVAALAERVGAANLVEPVSAVAGIVVPLLAEVAEASALAAELLAGLVDGSRLAALAHAEPRSGFSRDFVETELSRQGDGLRLDGAKAAIEGGARADTFLVTACDGDDLAILLVGRDAPGLTVTEYRAIDGRRLADLRLDGVAPIARLPFADAARAIDEALDRGAVLVMAEAVGAMAAAFDDTLAHLKSRKQFGKTLGSFQALQHRAVDMAIAVEEARAVVELAADSDGSDPAERRRAIATAKVIGARSARRVSREAVQLHGGMGITEELRVSHLFRRLVAAENLYGDRDFHLDRFRSEPLAPHAEVAASGGPRSTQNVGASFEAPLRGAPQDEEGVMASHASTER